MVIDFSKIPQVSLKYSVNVPVNDLVKVSDSKDVQELLRASWDNDIIEHHEQFKIMLLNRANKVLGIIVLSEGGTNGTVVDIKILCQYAILSHCSSIVIAHSHPSGNIKPSDADIAITAKIKSALQLFDISLLDALIITTESYYSFADEGLF